MKNGYGNVTEEGGWEGVRWECEGESGSTGCLACLGVAGWGREWEWDSIYRDVRILG
jgi:hypothetical protein